MAELIAEGMIPLYRQVADRIQSDIINASDDPSRPIPSELMLQQRYGVSRINNKEIYLFPDGKAWSYRENEVTDRKGKAYTEAIFLDITKKYEKCSLIL